MLGGIAFQLGKPHSVVPSCRPMARLLTLTPLVAAVCIYLILAAEFIVRYKYDKPVRATGTAHRKLPLARGIKFMIIGLALDGLFILIRSIYRTIVSPPESSSPLSSHAKHSLQTGIDRRLGWADHYDPSLLQ